MEEAFDQEMQDPQKHAEYRTKFRGAQKFNIKIEHSGGFTNDLEARKDLGHEDAELINFLNVATSQNVMEHK
jgi:hypothetical protein